MKITVVVLTFNESIHLERCLTSVRGFADRLLVVDSFSTDDTVVIAKRMGAEVLQHPFVNQAKQFNWALTQLPSDTQWVLRLDADEYVTPKLLAELKQSMDSLNEKINGLRCGRRMTFQGKLIRHGGVFPIRVVRCFRYGFGKSEDRWMDEHIVVSGKIGDLEGEIIDDNLNSLTWWVDKHNRYSNREAMELLNREQPFLQNDNPTDDGRQSHKSFKRWMKECVYDRLPMGLRAFGYFFYRFILRLGFLDGVRGTAFHVLQGFWYRYLVDQKVAEVKRYQQLHRSDIKLAVERVLGFKLSMEDEADRQNQT